MQSLVEARQVKDELTIGFATDALGRRARYMSDFGAARLLLEESAAILKHVGDLRRWGIVLGELGWIYVDSGDWKAAKKSFEEALSVAYEAHSRYHIAYNLNHLGGLALGMGNFDEALSLLNQAYQLVEGTPDDQWVPFILDSFGEIARYRGDLDQAYKFHREAIALQQWEEDINYSLLGNMERLLGELTEAKRHLLAGLKTINSWSNSIVYVIPYIAYFSIDQQMLRQSVCLFGWIDNWNKTRRRVEYPVRQAEFDRYLNQAREQLSESEFNAAWAEGQSMSQEQVLALAREVLQ